MTGQRSRRIYVGIGIAVACVAAAVIYWRHGSTQTAKAAPPSVPVIVTEAAQQDVPIYYDALGTVHALNTVAHPRPGQRPDRLGRFPPGPGRPQRRCAGENRSGAIPGRARSGRSQEERGRGAADRRREGFGAVQDAGVAGTPRRSRTSIPSRPKSTRQRRRSTPIRPPSRRRRPSSITPPLRRRSTAWSASARSISATSSTPMTSIRSRCSRRSSRAP